MTSLLPPTTGNVNIIIHQLLQFYLFINFFIFILFIVVIIVPTIRN